MATATAEPAAARTTIPGGDYRAEQNANGTWNIFDVPIFSEVPEGEKQNDQVIDLKWMQKAVDLHLTREQEKYLPPLHLFHHGTEKMTHPAGFFAPRRVGEILYGGDSLPAIFADMLQIPDGIFRMIEQAQFPYRSVEVKDWESGEIASLSLLDDEAPFFKLPLLTIGDKKENADVKRVKGEMGIFRGSRPGEKKQSAAYLFCYKGFGGNQMKKLADGEDKAKDKGSEKGDSMARCEKRMAALAAHLGLSFADDDSIVEGEKKEGEEKEKMSAGAADPKAPVENPNPGKGSAASDVGTIKFAELAGEVAALKAKDAKRDADEKVTALVTKAEEDLKGYNLSAGTKAQMRDFAMAGEKVLAAFVASVKRDMPKDPPTTLRDYESGIAGAAQIPPEVMKFSDKGPEAFEAAQKHYQTWAQLNAHKATSVSLERYLKLNMKSVRA